MKVALVVCLLAATAFADPVERAIQRKRAEEMERAAMESKDWEQYIAVAKAYLDIYNADPGAPDNDEVLYNAGVTFQEGRAISAAIHAYTLLERSYPHSPITPRALARLGVLYGDIAWYDKAAEALERYARKYAGERDAYKALGDAIFYRRALGDRSKVIANTNAFIKTYGAKMPREAADAMWALTPVYEADADATIKHLREYLRTFGAKGGDDRVVIAHAKIGALLWKRSCPHATVDGMCVKISRKPRVCGAGAMSTLTATKRVEARTKQALVELGDAVKAYERKGGAFDDPAARYWYVQAKLAEADRELEGFLALVFPRGLSFDPTNRVAAEKSVKRFTEWLGEKQKRGAAAVRLYEQLLGIKDADGTITAAARIATIGQALAGSLATGELPRDMRSGRYAAEKRQAYCDQITHTAAPLEARAVEGFGVCLAKSAELGWFTAASAHCERMLGELAPEAYPPFRELYAEPARVAPVLVLETLRR